MNIFNSENNSLKLSIEIPNRYQIHHFQNISFKENKQRFIFESKNIFGTRENAVLELKNRINKMTEQIEAMKKQCN